MLNTQLIHSLSQVSGNAIGSVETKTVVKLAGGKKNPMQGKVQKVTTGGSVMFFGNSKSNGYANMKNRRIEKVCSNMPFVPKKRAWGERIKQTPLITHKGNVYVEMVYLHPPKTSYLYKGQPIEKRDIEGLNKSNIISSSDVVLRTLKLENITRLKMGGLSVG